MEANKEEFENMLAEASRILWLTRETKDVNLMRFQISESKRLLTEAETAFVLLRGEYVNG